MKNLKKVFFVAAVTAVLVLPSVGSAATVEELQAMIQSLLAQLASLQQQLAQMQGGTQWCYTFNNNLKIGSSGSDVFALQTALGKEGFGNDVMADGPNGQFAEGTASAVTGFQEKYRDEILTPNRLSNGTGYVGPSTRAKLNALYGCEVTPPPMLPPVSPVSASATSSIQVLSPNGGEQWQVGSTQTIKWNALGDITSVSIYLYKNDALYKTIVTNLSLTYFTFSSGDYYRYNWTPSSADVGPGVFKIYIIGYKSDGGTVEDKSDAPFSVVAGTTSTQPSTANIFYARDYGMNLNASGITNTNALNAALRAAGQSTASSTKEVIIDKGIFTLGLPANEYVFITELQNSIRLHGAGMGTTTLKIADRVGPYHLILGSGNYRDPGHSVTDFSLEDLTIDGNSANNPISSKCEIEDPRPTNNCSPRGTFNNVPYGRFAVEIGSGRVVTIRRVGFANMAAENIIVTGVPVEKVIIRDNAFRNIGKEPNNIYHDHSTLYINGQNAEISNNTFIASGRSDPGTNTAIEYHAKTGTISQNTVNNYINGILVTAADISIDGVVVSNNNLDGVANGINLWALNNPPIDNAQFLKNVTIANNTIRINQNSFRGDGISQNIVGAHGISNEANANIPISGLKITNNNITFDLENSARGVSDPAHNNGGILFWNTKSNTMSGVEISGNSITNSPGAGIGLLGKWAFQNVNINNNTIINPGSGLDSVYWVFRAGMAFGLDEIGSQNVSVASNTISDNLDTTRMSYAVAAGGVASGVEFKENIINILGTKVSDSLKEGSIVHSGSYFIGTDALVPLITGNVDNFIPPAGRAKAGSYIIDKAKNLEWTLAADGTSWISNGPLAYFKFDEGQGVIIKDSSLSSTSHNGTLVGNASLISSQCLINSCLQNMNGGFVNIGNFSDLQLGAGTVSAWVKTSNAGNGWRGVVTKQNAYGLFLDDNNLSVYDWGSTTERNTGINLADGKWHHITMSFQSGVSNGTIIYIDGVPKLTTAMTVSNQNTGVSIGSGGTGTFQEFNGLIDEVRIYSRVLTADEIKNIYLSELPAGGVPAGGGGTQAPSNQQYASTLDSMKAVLDQIQQLLGAIR